LTEKLKNYMPIKTDRLNQNQADIGSGVFITVCCSFIYLFNTECCMEE